MATRSVEDYLKALYDLSRNGEAISTSEVSRQLKIAPPSVTEMLKKLALKGYVQYSPYKGTILTPRGRSLAEKTARKHRLLERFLHDVLKIRTDRVHVEACEMEHSLSDDAEESLCRFLRHPDTCPDDGKTIPSCDLPFSSCQECIKVHSEGLEEVGKRHRDLVPICNLKGGDVGKISFIRGERKVLQRLLDMGLTPGTEVTVVRTGSLKGPVEVAARGSKLALGRDIAVNVFIESNKLGS